MTSNNRLLNIYNFNISKTLSQKDLNSVVGTWHPRGYHGHYRAKSRIEFSDFYRQNAKPLPPEKFKKRQMIDVMSHTFSKHDNRQRFLNDPTLFGNGIGKKKCESVNKSKWNPDFMSWTVDAGRDRFNHTVYQNDFCEVVMNKRLLTGRKVLDKYVPVESTSMYKLNYSHNEPTKETIQEIQTENLSKFATKTRAKSCLASSERANVASCLVWNTGVSYAPKPAKVASLSSPTDTTQNSSVPSTESKPPVESSTNA